MTKTIKRLTCSALAFGFASAFAVGCGASNADDSSTSEVATSVVSGALNNSVGSGLAMNNLSAPPKSKLDRVLEAVNPIGVAWAASWSCSGGSLSPAFNGDGVYAYTPVSCTINWGTGKTASSVWSGDFSLNYQGTCDTTHGWIENQAAGCSVTRTATGGITRTITGPRGNAYAVSHDTNGAGSGWDASVSPAPSNGGVVVTCGDGGCLGGKTIVINGSHLKATSTPVNGTASNIWDHTVSTPAPIVVTGSGVNRSVSGTVTVQHNLAKFTATSHFDHVVYGEVGCCFPTSGTVTTTFNSGSNSGKTESLSFTNVCGEATLTNPDGTTDSITLQHCI